ncbi:MAG: hypothetical protein ACF8PN_12030 [Phycisphaerales bacterium]
MTRETLTRSAMIGMTSLAVAASTTSVLGAPREYEVLRLGDPRSATSLNERGEVTGGIFDGVQGWGFLTESRQPIRMPDDWLLNSSHVVDVSDSSVAIGHLQGHLDRFAVWYPNGTMEVRTVNDLPVGGGTFLYARAINQTGLMAGRLSQDEPQSIPFIYDLASHEFTMLPLLRDNMFSDVFDINDQGFAVGMQEMRRGGRPVGVLWAYGEAFRLTGLYAADAINNLNYIVGSSRAGLDGAYYDATGMHLLPQGEGAYMVAINDCNQTIGGRPFGPPLLWHIGSLEVVDLTTRIDRSLGLDLLYSSDINNQGEIIVTGSDGDYLLTPVRMEVTVDNLVAADTAVATVSGCESGADVWFFYSTVPPGDANALYDIEWGVQFDLLQPQVRGRATADSSGVAILRTEIEPGAAGTETWIQAYHIGNKSNIVNAVVMP